MKNLGVEPAAGSRVRRSTEQLHHPKMAETTFMVNGINCGSCKGTLNEALSKVDGLEVVSIATKSDTGAHPNAVVVKGASAEAVEAAIAELDGRPSECISS